jgi:predicted MPP superfamily phosphohydrolase
LAGWKYLPIFFIVVDLIILGIQLFFYLKVVKWAKDTRKPRLWRILANFVFFIFNVPLIFIQILRIRLLNLPGLFLYSVIYPFYLWHFSFIVMLLGYSLWKVLNLFIASSAWILRNFEIAKKGPSKLGDIPQAAYDSHRRKFVQTGVTVLIGSALGGSAYGTLTRNDYEISEVTLPIINLPGAFQNFTITLLTDIHSSVFMGKETMKKYVRAANELRSNVIAVAGDFVNSMIEEVYPFTEAFSELKAVDGVFGVLGNHDYFTGQVDLLSKEIDDCGIKLLLDDRATLTKGSERMYIIGADDTGSPIHAAAHFDVVLRGTEAQAPKILLCHRPYFFRQAAERDIDLTLSGHTHGGQIVFAKLGNDVIAPARMVSHYVAGLYTRGNSKMYISRGIGTVGIPIRMNCPPEITKFTLVKA